MRARTVLRIQTQMIHDLINGIARYQYIVGVAQMSVEIDPVGLDPGSISRKFCHWILGYCTRGRAQRSCSFSRACPAFNTRAPMASMMVRAFSTNCALLAYT